jgi:hypothetical protein
MRCRFARRQSCAAARRAFPDVVNSLATTRV